MYQSNSAHKKIQKGDIKEFEKLFREFYAPLCHFAYRYTKDMDAAEEIVQDLFYNYWKKKEGIEITTSIKSYLYQAVRNRSLKYLEHDTVKQKYAQEMKEQYEVMISNTTDELEASELDSVIEKTLNQLPERCREIFIMNRFDGFKYKEIAEKLSISIKTVEANMGKALQLFRTNLNRYDRMTC